MKTDRCSTTPVVIGLLIAACLPAGCATGQGKPDATERVFYPEPPAPPRLQFLTSFSNAQALKSKSKSSFGQWIVGTSKKDVASTKFTSPYGIGVHQQKLYICDVGSNKVHVLDLAARSYGTLQSDQIKNPVNITIDSDGTKYLTDTGVGKVLVFNEQDQPVGEFGEPGKWGPIDVAVRGDELFVTDHTGGTIQVWSKQGSFLRTIGEKGLGPDQLTNPTNLAFGPDGRLYVVDTFLQIVKVFDPTSGRFLGTVGRPGTQIGSFARPKGIAIDDDGTIFVTDSQWDVVQVFNPKGQLLMLFGAPGGKPWSMGLPAGLVIDRQTIDAFRPFLATNFEPKYLLFVVNQFGLNKIAVYAYGRDKSLPASAYEINMQAVQQRRDELKREAGKDQPNPSPNPTAPDGKAPSEPPR